MRLPGPGGARMSASDSPAAAGLSDAALSNAPIAPPESARSPGDQGAGWRPWHGRPRARDLICFFAIGVSCIYSMAMVPLTPALIASRPLLLEMLSGSNSAVVAAGSFCAVESKLALAVVIAGALPGMLRFDWAIWWAGRLWGNRIVEKLGSLSPRSATIAATAERRGTRFASGAVLLSALMPMSGAPVYAAAGWVGLPLVSFMILDAIGCAAWATLLAVSGYLLGSRGVEVAELVARYALGSVSVLVAAAAGPYLWQKWRSGRKGRRSLGRHRRAARRTASAPALASSSTWPARRCSSTMPPDPPETSGGGGGTAPRWDLRRQLCHLKRGHSHGALRAAATGHRHSRVHRVLPLAAAR
jgi:membrane protein DedA with SNARE-associated domain